MGCKKEVQKPKPAKRRLKSLSDARRFLADLINALNRDEIDSSKGSKLAYMISILGRLIEGGDLEKRVLALEAALKDQGGER